MQKDMSIRLFLFMIAVGVYSFFVFKNAKPISASAGPLSAPSALVTEGSTNQSSEFPSEAPSAN